MGLPRDWRHGFTVGLLKWSGERTRSNARMVLGLAGIVVFVLGWWGWRLHRVDTPSTVLDYWTITYRTVLLFVFDGSGAEPVVPWQLQVARLAAPVVLAASAIALAVAKARSWATAVAARTSTGHRIVVGPADLTGTVVLEGGLGGRSGDALVHVVASSAEIELCSERHLHVVRSNDWCSASGASRARQIVIDTGSDSRNVTALSAVEHHRANSEQPSATARVLAVIDDHSTAVDLAVLMARRSLDGGALDHIDVIDRTLDRAAAVADFLAMSQGLGSSIEFVLVGSSNDEATLVRTAVESMWVHFAAVDATKVPRLWLVATTESAPPTSWCDVEVVPDLATLERRLPQNARCRVVSIDDDPEVGMRHAMEASIRLPDSDIRVSTDEAAVDQAGILSLGLRRRPPTGLLERAAEESGLADRWPLACDRLIRVAIGTLSLRHDVMAVDRTASGVREVFLVQNGPELAACRRVIGSLTSSDLELLIQLPRRLSPVGISVVRRPEPPLAPFDHLDPAHVEVMAECTHDAYIAAEAAGGRLDPKRETHRPWSELSEQTKAKSRAQIQGFPELLALIGFGLVPRSDAGDTTVEVIPEELVEVAARREHDRWAEFTSRTDEHHVNLVAWEDLSEESKEKDRRPVRSIPEMVALAGLAVVPRPGSD